MSGNLNYYQILEVSPDADLDTLKSAYRRLARQYHPDVNPNNPSAEAQFKQISEAYHTVCDAQRRAIYDITHRIDKKSSSAAASARDVASKQAAPPKKTAQKSGAPRRDLNKKFTDKAQTNHFKDMFDSLFKKEGSPPTPPSAKPAPPPPSRTDPVSHAHAGPSKQAASHAPLSGENITLEALITQDEAQSGVVKTIHVQHTESCTRCSATGRLNGMPCPVCHGEKHHLTVRKIEVRIPAGVRTGAKVRVAKEGGKGLYGGDAGDLFLLIRIQADQALKIDGATVTCDLPLSIPEAVLGAEVDVPTVGGMVKMLIPPLTPSGKVFRLKGQGVTQHGVTGDQFVTVLIVPPKVITAHEKQLYEQLAKLQHDHPRAV